MSKPAKPRAVIYCRVSSDPRGTGRSVGEQETECRAIAEREGWRVVKTFTDNDRSASRYAKKGRPEYQALADFIEAGSADILVCWEASRAQRDLKAYLSLRDLCEKRGVLWSYSGRTYNLRDGDDRFTTGLDALLADREVDVTRKRVLRATSAAAGRGTPHGKLLYGYGRSYKEGKKGPELVAQTIREDQAAVVREAARRFSEGEAANRIAKDLNDRKIPAPRGGEWNLTQIRRLISNPAYIAKRVHQGKVVGDGMWPPILDEATFYAVAARLNDPARRLTREGSVRHLLTGIALCGVCDGPTALLSNRGSPSYVCKRAFHVSRLESAVDKIVEAVIVERLTQPDLLDLLSHEDDVDARAANDEAAGLRARLTAFYDSAAAGDLTPAALARIEATLMPQIEAAEAAARRRTSSPLVAAIAGPDAAVRWEKLVVEQKREIIRTLVEVRILPVGVGRRTFDPEKIRITWKEL